MIIIKTYLVKADIDNHEVNDKFSFTVDSRRITVTEIFKVELCVYSAIVINEAKTPAVVKKSCTATFLSNLEKLLNTGEYADVEIHCKDGEVVKCHKILLAARSPVFKTMLDSDFKEKDSGTIKLDYMEIGIVKVIIAHFQNIKVEIDIIKILF